MNKYFNISDLRDRGWIDRLIYSVLGEPDSQRPSHWWDGRTAKLYLTERVLQLEAEGALSGLQAMRNRRIQRIEMKRKLQVPISKQVMDACLRWTEDVCPACDGEVERWYVNSHIAHVCPHCDGRGSFWRHEHNATMISAAKRSKSHGGSEEQQIMAAQRAKYIYGQEERPPSRHGASYYNDLIGSNDDSTLGLAVMRGSLTMEEAKQKWAEAVYRHEQTNYDLLLAQGMSRMEARQQMKPMARYTVSCEDSNAKVLQNI